MKSHLWLIIRLQNFNICPSKFCAAFWLFKNNCKISHRFSKFFVPKWRSHKSTTGQFSIAGEHSVSV